MTSAPNSPNTLDPSTATTTTPPARFDRRILFVVATPLFAWLVGAIAMPHPRGVTAELQAFDRGALKDVILAAPRPPSHVVNATLGGIKILGADLPKRALSRGERLPVTLYFEVVEAVEADWQVFVHVDAKDGRYRLNGDHYPAGGRYRTGLWQVGEHIADRFERAVTGAMPAGEYDVWIGFYRGQERLPFRGGDRSATDGENRVRVGSIVLE